MPRTARTALVLLALASCLLLGVACGGGGSSGDDNIGTCSPPFSDDLTGSWVLDQVWQAGECAFVGPSQGMLVITQNDNQLTIFGQGTTTATLCGSRAESNSSFSYLVNGGTMTITRFLLTFSSETQATGNSNWTWRNNQGAETCSGTSTLTLQR